MSEENNRRNSNNNPAEWFERLIEKLPLKKLTRAQTLNALCDGLGWLGFIMYIFSAESSRVCALIMFITLVLFMVWCIKTSKPMIRR